MRLNRGVSRGDRGGVRGCCGVGLAYNFLLESKISLLVRGAFHCGNPVAWVSAFLNETKVAHLFERCV